MSTMYNLSGTTKHNFKIGGPEGINLTFGNSKPTDDYGKVGDIFISTTGQIDVDEVFKDNAELQDAMPVMHQEFIDSGKDFFSVLIQQPTGYNNPQLYKYDGTNVTHVRQFNIPQGKIYYKTRIGDNYLWQSLGIDNFDSALFDKVESLVNPGDYDITIKSADNNNVVSSTKQNDYDADKNRSSYGVVRFATSSETYAQSSGVDKFIVETPAQIKADIEVEKTRAQGVEGDLNNLNAELTNTNLVAAINSELTRAEGIEGELKDKIDTLIAKSDVVDLVGTHAELIAYDSEEQELGANDVIKVLADETDQNATSYYRWSEVPTTVDVDVATKAALDAYPTSGLQDGAVAHVTLDESLTPPAESYYEFRVIAGQPTWVIAGPSYNTIDYPDKTFYWKYIGDQGPFYTTDEADGLFVRKTGNFNETVTGEKTFTDVIYRTADVTTAAGQGVVAYKLTDTNSTSSGYILDKMYYAGSQVIHRISSINSRANKDTYLDVTTRDNGTGRIQIGGNASSYDNLTLQESGTSSTVVATLGWVNNPDTALNVVHRNGDETITGIKTMTGATVLVATQTQGDNSTKAASTAYVDAGIAAVEKIPSHTSTNAGQVLAVSQDGTTLYWKTVKDISTLRDLEDTVIANPPTDGDVLVYDETTTKWVNGRQVAAVISYW